MLLVPPIFAVTGTLVADVDLETLLDPDQIRQYTNKLGPLSGPVGMPLKMAKRLGMPHRPVLLSFEVLHRFGLIPDPHRLMADSAYYPLKGLGDVWVQPLVDLGLAPRRQSVDAARLKLRELKAAYPGRKVIGAGQSQGGPVILELALEPEFRDDFASLTLAGAPLEGVPKLDEFPLNLATVFPGVAEMKCDSPSLALLRHRAARELHIPIDLMGSSDDTLVPLKSALELGVPEGVEKRRYRTGSRQPVDIGDTEDAEYLAESSWLPHVGMCWRESFLALMRKRREQFTVAVTDYRELELNPREVLAVA